MYSHGNVTYLGIDLLTDLSKVQAQPYVAIVFRKSGLANIWLLENNGPAIDSLEMYYSNLGLRVQALILETKHPIWREFCDRNTFSHRSEIPGNPLPGPH